MRKRFKQISRGVMAILAIVAFLVMCAEPAPGEDIDLLTFTVKEFAAFVLFGFCLWAIGEIDKKKEI